MYQSWETYSIDALSCLVSGAALNTTFSTSEKIFIECQESSSGQISEANLVIEENWNLTIDIGYLTPEEEYEQHGLQNSNSSSMGYTPLSNRNVAVPRTFHVGPFGDETLPEMSCPISARCARVACEDFVQHLLRNHRIESTVLDEDSSFRMALSFTSLGESCRSGVIIKLERSQHLLWLMERVTDTASGYMHLALSVYALHDYVGPELGVRISCIAHEGSRELLSWKGRIHRLTEGAQPRTMRLQHPGPNQSVFGRTADGKLSLVMDTTVMAIVRKN